MRMSEHELSALADKLGYRIEKASARSPATNEIGYKLVENSMDFVVIGDERGPGLDEIATFLIGLRAIRDGQ